MFGTIDDSPRARFVTEVRNGLTHIGHTEIVNIENVPTFSDDKIRLCIDLADGNTITLDITSHKTETDR